MSTLSRSTLLKMLKWPMSNPTTLRASPNFVDRFSPNPSSLAFIQSQPHRNEIERSITRKQETELEEEDWLHTERGAVEAASRRGDEGLQMHGHGEWNCVCVRECNTYVLAMVLEALLSRLLSCLVSWPRRRGGVDELHPLSTLDEGFCTTSHVRTIENYQVAVGS